MAIIRTLIVGCIGLAGLSAAVNYGTGAWLRAQPTIQGVQTTGWPLHIGADMRGVSLPSVTLTGANVLAPIWNPLSLRGDIILPATTGHGVLTGQDSTADVSFGYAAHLPVASLSLDLTQPQLAFNVAPDMPITAERAQGTLIRQPDGDYALNATITNLGLPSGTVARHLSGVVLEDRIESVTTQADLTFGVPPSANGAEPELDAVELTNLSVLWGGRTLNANGTLHANPAGLAEGTVNLITSDWEAWLAVAHSAGWLGGNYRVVEMVLRGLAAGSTDNSITIPVNFAAGRMSIGPLPTNIVIRLR